MPKFASLQLPIAAKAVLLIAMLGLLSIAANWFCLQRLDELNKLNTLVSEHIAPARLAMAEAKAAIESFGIGTYKSFSATDPDDAKEAAADIKSAYDAAKARLNSVVIDYPNAKDEVRVNIAKLDNARALTVELHDALQTGDRNKARFIVELKFDPARDDLVSHMNHLINVLGGEAQRAEDESADRGEWIFRLTIAILAGGTAAVLLGAFILSHLFIARPLRRMAATMTRMAGGDLSVSIVGADRRDEIGAMARAVEVFRDNTVALRETEQARATDREQSATRRAQTLDTIARAIESEILTVAAAVEQSVTELEACARGMSSVISDSR